MDVINTKINTARYTAYKDSGVEWFGEIPSHWRIERGKWLFKKEERSAKKDDEIVTCFRDGQVTLRINRKTEGFTNALKEYGYQGIRKGDLVIHNMDAFAGSIGVSDSDGKSTPVYSVCTPRLSNTVDAYYYCYFLRNLAKNGFIESLAKGIRERSTDFRFADFGKLELPLPPLEEQTAIAKFLDTKTVLIDKAISVKEQQIALLKERRQAIIHKAVTQGLNPNVALKPSGVDWIGDIPEHWEVKKLKHLVKLITTKNDSTTENFPYIGMENIESWTGKYLTTNSEVDGIANYFEQGDVLFGKLRPYLAKVFLTDEKGKCSSEFLVLRCNERILNSYLAKLLLSYRFITLVDSSTYGSKMPRANYDFIGNQFLAFPNTDEQTKIKAHIDDISIKISSAISFKEQEITKLKEFKASLINTVVTGKIKIV